MEAGVGDWRGVLEGAHEGPWAPREEVGILVMGVILISAPHPNHHDLSGGFSCPPTHCEMLGEASVSVCISGCRMKDKQE